MSHLYHYLSANMSNCNNIQLQKKVWNAKKSMNISYIIYYSLRKYYWCPQNAKWFLALYLNGNFILDFSSKLVIALHTIATAIFVALLRSLRIEIKKRSKALIPRRKIKKIRSLTLQWAIEKRPKNINISPFGAPIPFSPTVCYDIHNIP